MTLFKTVFQCVEWYQARYRLSRGARPCVRLPVNHNHHIHVHCITKRLNLPGSKAGYMMFA